jgi:CubicO group peptidase (beta-lactamase class C family)
MNPKHNSKNHFKTSSNAATTACLLSLQVLLVGLLFTTNIVANELPYGWLVTNGFRNQAKIALVKPPPEKNQFVLKNEEAPDQAKSILNDLFSRNNSKALVLAQGSTVLYEKYSFGVGKRNTPLGYSMSKSLAALTVGKAICDGHIKSLDTPLKDHLPNLSGTSWGEASVRSVLLMSSGAYSTSMQFNGHKNREMEQFVGPSIAEGKMNTDFTELMLKSDEKRFEPGRYFNYSNLDTVALGLLVQAATGMPFNQYFEKTIWADSGTESQGAWFINGKGQASTYNGFSARPHDWVRIGLMVLRELKDESTCFGKFLSEGTKKQINSSGPANGYGYQIWTQCGSGTDFCFVGFGGQYLLFNVENNLVLYHHATTTSPIVWRTPEILGPVIEGLKRDG